MARILVVEDNAQVRMMLKMTLERVGYEVDEAPDGQKAIVQYNEKPADIVITDIVMPEKEGIEMIRDLRKENPDVQIIAISGGGGVGDATAYLRFAQKLGAAYTFSKPVDREALLEAVQACLSGTDEKEV